MTRFRDPKTGVMVYVKRKLIAHAYIRVKEGKRVEVSAPIQYSDAQIKELVAAKTEWIKKCMGKVADKKEFRYLHGEIHHIFGDPFKLEAYYDTKNECFILDDRIIITVVSNRSDRKRLFVETMKNIFYPVVNDLLDKWEPIMGVKSRHVNCRILKSRWGSCNVDTGDMCFALDLVTKPEDLIELVVVHELNHLLEKGHTPRFHDLMAHWLPDYKQREARLRSMERELV